MHIPSKCNFRIEQSNGFSIEEHNRRLLPVKEDFNYNAYSLLVRQRDNSYLEDMSLMCLMTIISYDYQYIYIHIHIYPHFGQHNFLSRQTEHDSISIESKNYLKLFLEFVNIVEDKIEKTRCSPISRSQVRKNRRLIQEKVGNR